MSCQQNSAAAAGAAGKNGISSTASKVAYVVGATTVAGVSAAGGGLIGGGIGSLLGPVGTVAGAATGAAIGGKLGYEVVRDARDTFRERRQQAAEEQAWKDSKAGGRAIKTKTTQLRRAKEAYTNATAGIKAKKDTATERYQAVRDNWMSENTGLNAAMKGGAKGAVMTPEAKAAAAGVAAGAINILGQAMNEARGGGPMAGGQGMPRPAGRDLGRKMGAEAVQQARQYGERVEQAKMSAWLSSPEGKAANSKYQKTMKRFKAQEEQHAGQYKKARAAANRRYNTARSNFSSQYKKCAAQRATAASAVG